MGMRSRLISRHFAVLVGAALLASASLGVAAPPGQTFGSVVVKPSSKYRHDSIHGKSVVHNLDVVDKTKKELASLTASQASGAQVVTLPYSPHKTYTIPVRVGMFVTFALPKKDPISQFAVSTPGAVQLHVNAKTNTAMLKLIQQVTVVGTIVTTKRIYYLSVVPAAAGRPWYQGVNWSYASNAFGASDFSDGVYVNTASPAPGPTQERGAASSGPLTGLYKGEPNFDYTITGSAPFRPIAVWDNGRFTWIQFAKNLSALPAVFLVGPNGLEIVNYTVHDEGTQILVNRLMPDFILKIGKARIEVKAGGHVG